jgi:hypothetical protein
MKKILTVLSFVLISTNCFATHLLGGHISYKFISQSATTSTYEINISLYRESTGVGIGTTVAINVESSSGVSSTVVCSLTKPEYMISSLGIANCGASMFNVGINEYSGFVTIQNGYNYQFYWQSCCRPAGIMGITNPSGVGFYIDAKLNLANQNTRGFDNSVEISPLGILRMAFDKYNSIPTLYTEDDGDSIYATLKPAKEFAGTGGTSVPYATGYSALEPIHSDSLSPFTLDSEFNGIFGKPTQLETSVVSFRIDNYVLDTATGNQYRIGYVTADLPITVSVPPPGNDTILISSMTSVFGNSSQLIFDNPIYSNSISSDLSEFQLSTLNGISLPGFLTEAYQLSQNQFGLSDTLEIIFDSTITSGFYELFIQQGSDSNTFMGQCGGKVLLDSFLLNIPFVSSSILGPDSVYNVGTYAISNSNQIDSLMWIVNSGLISYQGQSDTFLLQIQADSVEVEFFTPSSSLTVIRFGQDNSDTLKLNVVSSGITIDDNSLNSIILSPNPNSGLFSIQVDQEHIGSSYHILDNLGRLIDKGIIRELSQDFDLSDKPKGIYRIQVSNEKAIKTLNVVIQ